MPFELLTPNKKQTKLRQFEQESTRRKARDKVCLVAEQNRVSWQEVQKIALELVGKKEGLSISECKRVIEEIRKRIR